MAKIYAPATPQVCPQSRTDSCSPTIVDLDPDHFACVLAIFDASILGKIIVVGLFSLGRDDFRPVL